MKDGIAETNSTLSNYDSRIAAQERNLIEQKSELNSAKGYLSNVESMTQRISSELSRRS